MCQVTRQSDKVKPLQQGSKSQQGMGGRTPDLDNRKMTTANIFLNIHCALDIGPVDIGLVSMCQFIGPYTTSMRLVLILFLVYR